MCIRDRGKSEFAKASSAWGDGDYKGAAGHGGLASLFSLLGVFFELSPYLAELGASTAVGMAIDGSCPSTRNGRLAGGEHPSTSIPFDEEGFADFSGVRHPNVEDVHIEPSGNRTTDAARANAAAGLEETPPDYVWHHHQDPGRMQLVEVGPHKATGHTGGFSIWGKK